MEIHSTRVCRVTRFLDSKMPGIDYFVYFPEISGSETVTIEVDLPEHVNCRALVLKQIRDLGPVFISRLEIQSNQLLIHESTSEKSDNRKVK